MKTLILTTALVVLTTLSFAQIKNESKEVHKVLNTEDVKASIYPNSNDMVTLMLQKKPGEVVTIKVIEESGKILYTKRIKKADTTRTKFDIHQFPAGEYTFELVKDRKVLYTKKINKSENVVAISK